MAGPVPAGGRAGRVAVDEQVGKENEVARVGQHGHGAGQVGRDRRVRDAGIPPGRGDGGGFDRRICGGRDGGGRDGGGGNNSSSSIIIPRVRCQPDFHRARQHQHAPMVRSEG